MKKLFLCAMLLICSMFQLSVFAQNYHEDDKEGLRRLLRLKDKSGYNLNLINWGLAVSDTIYWHNSEDWISKILNASSVIRFNDVVPKRLISISAGGFVAGNLDCRKFEYLREVKVEEFISEVDFSNNLYLETLTISGAKIVNLDLSNNVNLESLTCFGVNTLAKINITGCAQLKEISIEGGDFIRGSLEELDLSTNINLISLNCKNNKLKELDLSNNVELKVLFCSGNNLTDLNLEHNTNLIELSCRENFLARLDLSKNLLLDKLDVTSNQLVTLDLSSSINLRDLSCYDNKLTSLDVSNNSKLVILGCSSNEITSLNLLSASMLSRFYCDDNKLTNLDVSSNTSLATLDCYNNNLVQLDISGNRALYEINCSGNQLTNLDISKNLQLQRLEYANNNIPSLDISKHKGLTLLDCSNNQVSSLDVSLHSRLIKLVCSDNDISYLDVSKCELLEVFDCSNNKLVSLDVAKSVELYNLNCSNNQLKDLDVTNNRRLGQLNCSNNQLADLSLDNSANLFYLFCSNNKLKELSLAKITGHLWEFDCSNNELNRLDVYSLWTSTIGNCSNNYLRFSELPPFSNISSHTYTPQAVILGEDVFVGDEIDLSREYNIENFLSENYVTTYEWYDSKGKELTLLNGGNGKFILNVDVYDSIVCKMTNPVFPNLTQVYMAKVLKTKAILQDHLKLKTATDNVYSVNVDESFKVYAKANNQDDVKIGLFSSQGIFKGQIDLSRKNSTYTCQVPSNTNEGDYIILPYVIEAGVRVPVARADKSHLIDQLPVKVIAEDIWGRSIAVYSEGNVLKSLQMKTAENNLFEVAVEQQFQVYAPASESSTSIGLFDLEGVFLSDIASAKNNYTYKCEIPFEFEAGNYIIMPYVKEDGVVKVVERSVGAIMIDRLPLLVAEGDIWSRSVEFRTVNSPLDIDNTVSVYPNPVADLLYFNTSTPAYAVEIYDMAGRLVKKIISIVGNSVSVQDLISGIYVVKIKTSENETMHKIKKN